MTHHLPQSVLERIFLLDIIDHRKSIGKVPSGPKALKDLLESLRPSQADTRSFSLVSRSWGRAFLAAKWATTPGIFWEDVAQVGDICEAVCVP